MTTGLIALELVARLNQQDVDIRAIIRDYALTEDELTPDQLLHILRKQQFKTKLKHFQPQQFPADYPLPAIVRTLTGSYLVVLKLLTDEQKLVVFDPQDKQTKAVSYDTATRDWSGLWIILRHKTAANSRVFGFKWFFYEILTYKRIIFEVMTAAFMMQLFGLVSPLFTQVILDKVIVHHSLITLRVLAIAFLAVAVFDFLMSMIRNYLFIHTASKIDAKLGAKLFRHLFALPFRYFESRKVGNIIARVRELDQIREFITNKAVTVLLDVLFASVFLLMMALYSVKLTLIAVSIVTLIGLIYALITPIFRRRLDTKFQMSAQSQSYLVEAVTGIQTVKSLAIEGSMAKKWEDNLGQYITASFNLGILGQSAQAVVNFLQKMITLLILFFGVQEVIGMQLTIGQLIAFQMFSNQFTGPVLRLVGLWNELQQVLLGIDRLGDILNHPTEVVSDKAITLPDIKGQIVIDELSFKYHPEAQQVLNRVSLTIEAGESIGLVGRSGSGKSTIAKLIQRLYLAQNGTILIDGIDIRHMNPFWLRHQIGIVLQDNYLFSGTIRENITLSRPEASTDMIIAAARQAGAHDFISQFPEGYDTMVGERGSSLSGGQKQRIAIARALITNPRILIFDEATSALDLESESVILSQLDTIKQNRTVIIIAHRLSTIRGCDRILAMDNGEIVETGTHSDLITQNGYYAQLHRHQETPNAQII